MKCHSKICFALVLTSWFAPLALGQFPWSQKNEAPANVHKTGQIAWKTDIAEATKLAREQRKLLLLHFSGTHCAPCRKLEDNVLNRNDVAVTMLSRYVPVFIVADRSPDLVEQFHVQGWPTDVIIDVEGREIARHVSPQDPREFIKRISMIAAKHHAGQSATIANVRAAVAADVTEKDPTVQQTAADDRKPPRQSPPAESKIVHNPHANDGRLPPIVVARNSRTKATPVEEEGFSPPNKRRMPPIVRRTPADTAEEEVPARTPSVKSNLPSQEPEELLVEADSDVAPWRKNGKPVHSEPIKVPAAPIAKHDTPDHPIEKVETAPDEVAPPMNEKSHAAEEIAAKPTESAAEPLTNVATEPELSETQVEKEPAKPDSAPAQEVTPTQPEEGDDKTQKTEQPESKKDETVEPVQEQEAPVAEPKTEEHKTEEIKPEAPAATQPESEPEVAEQNEPAPVVENSERRSSKSRFADDTESPSSEQRESTTKEPTETPAADTASEPTVEPETKAQRVERKLANAPLDESNDEKPVDRAKEENAKPETAPAEENTQVEKETELEGQVAEPEAKQEVSAAKPQPKKPIQRQAAATVAKPESKRQPNPQTAKKEEGPRGVAKIARSGKYVLQGNCCVTMVETGKLKMGNPQFGAIHRGRIYLFASTDARTKFLANPDDYSPMLSGYDPVVFAETGELVDTIPQTAVLLPDNRMVAFASEASFDKFKADYDKVGAKSHYLEAVRTAMKETNGGRFMR